MEGFKNGNMSKEEAIKMMGKGKRMTHIYFSKGEWVTYWQGSVLFEDNVRMPINQFWADRQLKGFNDGWSEFKSQ